MQRYAEAVLEFDLDRLKVLAFRGDETRDRVIVKTIMRLDDGTEVPVNYGMVKRDDGWLMFDVIIEGISYIRNFKTELNAEIQEKGLGGVIDRLESELNGAATE
jgi:phospholipid transport system substrate-binding protein